MKGDIFILYIVKYHYIQINYYFIVI